MKSPRRGQTDWPSYVFPSLLARLTSLAWPKSQPHSAFHLALRREAVWRRFAGRGETESQRKS